MSLSVLEGASQLSDFDEIAEKLRATSLRTSNQRYFSINQVTDQSGIENVKKTMQEWSEAMSGRVAFSRRRKDASDAAMQQFTDDNAQFKSYRQVMSYLKEGINALKKEKKEQKSNSEPTEIQILTARCSDIIQAIACIKITTNDLHLTSLFSAPWNVKMHAPIDALHQSLVVKGAGSFVMEHLYALAQSRGLSQISLTPTGSASSFYEKIGMQFDEDRQQYIWKVTQEID